MSEYLDYLWYIIPGTILLFPLRFIGDFDILFSSTGNSLFLSFLLLAFISGYVMHQVYRILHYSLMRCHRPLVYYLRKGFQDALNKGEVESLYNYLIYCSHKDEIRSRIRGIMVENRICSSIITSFLATVAAMIIIAFSYMYMGLTSFPIQIIVIYLIMLIVFLFAWAASFHWLNSKEMIITEFHMNEFRRIGMQKHSSRPREKAGHAKHEGKR